jgi:photosystem II stability/assembly factor-like uncharacterized protein
MIGRRCAVGLLVAASCLCTVGTLRAQQKGDFGADFVRQLNESKYGILSNSISNLQADGLRLWVGPYLNVTNDGGASWQVADSDSLFGSSNRVFSLDAEGDVLVVGLGKSDASSGQAVPTAAGFLVSADGGQTFEYRYPQLDQPTDTTVTYGVSVLQSLPVIVPQQSPPYDIDYDPSSGRIWVAGWASGVRKSDDFGRTWERVVLPPDDLEAIYPDSAYAFRLEPRRGSSGSLNHMGFGVLVDASSAVWAGTAGGVNLSLDGGSSWRKMKADGTAGSLTGNWVVSIEEQILPGDDVVWMATWNTGEVDGEQFGVTYTSDHGITLHQALHGERIYDFAFDGATIYAAGDNGLFISEDAGATWRSVRAFRDREDGSRIVRPGTSVFAVERVGDALWVGTGDGLLKSLDGGGSWTLYRTEVPPHPDEPTERVPDVETFAYPNPFSPAGDQFVRIRTEVDSASDVSVRIFDFGMNLVREFSGPGGAGIVELRWDGMDERGTRVANGPYFYEVRSGKERFRGKILVIE